MIKSMSCEICNITFEYLYDKRRIRKVCSLKCNARLTVDRNKYWDNLTNVEQMDRLRYLFEQRIIKEEGCWGWKGTLLSKRGRIYFKCKPIQAHRASWLLHKGEIPEGMIVCHTCDNEICSNPDHLFLGTKKINAQDAARKKRFFVQKLGINDVYKIRELLETNIEQKEIAKMFNVSTMTISDIKLKKTWSHV